MYWPPREPMVLPTEIADVDVLVFVNDGRWVVVCPTCGEGQAAARDDHRLFCLNCRNAYADGRWVRVVWPDDVDAIEAVLEERPSEQTRKRPSEQTRKWRPDETVASLRVETAAQARTSVLTADDLAPDVLERLHVAHHAFFDPEDPADVLPEVAWSPEGEPIVKFPKRSRR